MTLTRESLIKNFTSAIIDNNAAFFIGAGMSRPSGFVDWKALLGECARELGLDLDRENDYVAVAQYYLNNRNRDRSRLNQIIRQEFDKNFTLTEKHKIIARMPIATVWTTNYDSLLEAAFGQAGRSVDLKTRDQDVAIHKKGRDVVLYKMHGDVMRPDEVIICKDDYECYDKRHKVLQNTLEGDLVSKTFLFLGFSFADPNLKYILGHLRSLLEDSKREHYSIMRRARFNRHIPRDIAEKRYAYDKRLQDLQISDLQRYSIQTHLIEKFDDIEEILNDIEKTHNQRNVFVSGSAIDFGEFKEERVRDFCMELGERLIDENLCLISGMGLNIGDSVVKGAVLKLYQTKKPICENNIILRPFPRNLPTEVNSAGFYEKYRKDMIQKCGFAIFISGNSSSAKDYSRGVCHEFELATQLSKIPIPIGATGFAAKKIWKLVERKFSQVYSDLVSPELFARLNDPTLNNTEILDAVFEIINVFREFK